MTQPDESTASANDDLPEEWRRVYRPRFGGLAKTIAILILLLLVAIPILFFLLSFGKVGDSPARGPEATMSTTAHWTV